jgi:multidrug efflux system membrane fusion protein
MMLLRKMDCGMRNILQLADQGFAGRLLMLSMGALLLVLPACSKGKQPSPRSAPVTVATVDKKDVPLQIKAIGNVEAYNTVSVKSQVNGEISEVFFREGQEVRAGERLFQIDRRPFEAALRQAESALARDRAQATNAAVDAERYSALAAKGFVSHQEFDSVRTNSEALQAVVSSDEAAVENARLQLGYTLIASPIDGRTGSIQIKKGNVVKANDLPLVTINQLIPINVSFSVPEQDLTSVKRYRANGELRVEATIPQSSSAPLHGTLTFIDNAVNTATGTIQLKATFSNQDHALWPGQFVDVTLTLTTERDRIIVPSAAVQTGQEGQYVFVVKDDQTAELRPVTPGRTVGDRMVIEKGLQTGETVVTDGQLRLVPGTKVDVKSSAAAQAEEGPKTQMTHTN